MSQHVARIVWRSTSLEDFLAKKFKRAHTWYFDGGITINASSSPLVVRPPFSDEAAVDPEEALVASAASCHMLTFLWLASKAGYAVTSYEDHAQGELSKNEHGVFWMATITLRPKVEWASNVPTAQELSALHHQAHEACYIANSLKTHIVVEPQ